MQQSQSPHGIGGGVENQLGPLRAPRILQSDSVHSGAGDEARQFFHFDHRSIRWLEGPDPSVAFNVIPNVSGGDGMAGGKRGAANHEFHMLSDNFFVADAVLYRADSAVFIENVGDLCDCGSSVDRLSRHDAVIAAWQTVGIAGGLEPSGEIGSAGKPQSVGANGIGVLFPDIVGPDFRFALLGEVSGKQTAYRSATDDADFHF